MKNEGRDYEILRTMVRLHFVTYAQVCVAFFSSPDIARRRLRKLQGGGLITRHTLGAEPRSNYCAWRITSEGIAALAKEIPNQNIPEQLDERLQRQSLIDNYHREGVGHLYLELLKAGAGEPLAPTHDGVRKWTALLRTTADRFEWQADGDVLLRGADRSEAFKLVPDATVTPVAKPLRLFIELDRSHKASSRIDLNLRRYAAYLRGNYLKDYPDRRTPVVVYVVGSAARRGNLQKLAQGVLGSFCKWKVLLAGEEATAWLSDAVLAPLSSGASPPEAVRPDLFALAHTFLNATAVLLRNGSALFEEFEQESPEVVAPWRRALAALYDGVHLQPEPGHAG